MYDVLVIGGGIAGLRAAVAARSHGASVAVVSKAHPTRSHSVTIQDGISSALQPDDSWETHAADTTTAGEGLCNPEVVNAVCREAPDLVRELDRMGVPFNRNGTDLECVQLRGSSHSRTAFVDDMSGLVINQTLYEQALRAQIPFYDEWTVTSLVMQDGACRGVIALELSSGKLELLSSKAVVLATGGPRRLYEPSTSSLLCSGDGMAMAYRAGAPLVDMEFVQYHPAVLKDFRLAVTELAWAHGAALRTANGAAIPMENTGAAVLARTVQEAADADGGSVALHTQWTEEQSQGRFFNTWYRVKQLAGIDLTQEAMPVRPAMHRVLGGIATDSQGATEISGLYAAGECAGSGLHGSAGQDGNFLLAAVALGKAAGQAAAEYARSASTAEPSDEALRQQHAVVTGALGRNGKLSLADMRQELAGLMHSHVGMVREESGLQQALKRIGEMKETYPSLGAGAEEREYNFGLVQYLELGFLLDIAEVIAAGALTRQESRGVHFRSDHPTRDDDSWRKHLLVTAGDSGPTINEGPLATS